ncbi:MAG: helix-turn-helix domain-containing protein [Bacteroidetes bacterium]|nr:MAG: helix-turn-helix domain-containing protein [Bacteroidota bacterium]
MKTLRLTLKNARTNQALTMQKVAQMTGINQALISKFESGDRLPTEAQLFELSNVYNIDFQTLKALWLAEKIVRLVQYEPVAIDALSLAESRVAYLRSTKHFDVPDLTPEMTAQLATIDQLRRQWQSVKPLNPTQLRKMEEYFRIEYTFESNRIEGNTLTLHETGLVVQKGLTISGKTMVEHLEAINHAEAVEFVTQLATNQEDLTPRTLLELHAIILKSIDKENAGRYRRVPVMISGSKHRPPEPWLLDKLMEDYFVHYENQKGRMHPVILASEMHERLVSIHPFIDGNGRTSRLVMNLILLRNGYTIANLKGDAASRLAYYRALEKVQTDNEPEVFYRLVMDAVEASLRAHLALV